MPTLKSRSGELDPPSESVSETRGCALNSAVAGGVSFRVLELAERFQLPSEISRAMKNVQLTVLDVEFLLSGVPNKPKQPPRLCILHLIPRSHLQSSCLRPQACTPLFNIDIISQRVECGGTDHNATHQYRDQAVPYCWHGGWIRGMGGALQNMEDALITLVRFFLNAAFVTFSDTR